MKIQCASLLLALLATALHRVVLASNGHNMGGTIVSFIDGLERDGYLNTDQADFIRQRYPDEQEAEDWHSFSGFGLLTSASSADEVRAYLEEQVHEGLLSPNTKRYLWGLLKFSRTATAYDEIPSIQAVDNSFPSSYTGNGIVNLIGQANPSPPQSSFFNDERYNGIWGYAVGSREYALQCHSDGLHIIDVTSPPFVRVQYIYMAGGTIWRDVETWQDPSSGVTYAYVAAQSDGNLFVVDLSALSGSSAHAADSAECTYVDRGRTNYGHTLTVRDGYLFLNSANSQGCQIFDLRDDPWDPRLLSNSYEGSMHDCHDSLARNDVHVPGSGNRNLLYSADGNTGKFRIVDITDLDSGATPVVIGETPDVGSAFAFFTYAHSCYLSEDSNYLYVFEESDDYDMAVFDVSDPRNPSLIRTFALSGNYVVHNGQVRGDFLFVAYYKAGFRVFDISDPTNPVEVGKYETYQDDGLSFSFNEMEGAWNVYSFLPSGRVLVSDQQSGLFVFDMEGTGATDPPPPTEPTVPAPTPASPTSTGACTDLPFDSYYTCDIIFDAMFCDIFGADAMASCCICGGGSQGGQTPSAPPPSPSPGPGCTDLQWDPYLTCDFILDPAYCSFWGTGPGSASDACCICGGGSSGSASPPGPTGPSPTPPTGPTGPSSGRFNIELINVGSDTSFDQAFRDAKARWEAIIVNDLEDVPAQSESPFDWFDGLLSGTANQMVDDVLIGYEMTNIDGYGGTLGQAGPTYARVGLNDEPTSVIAGVMMFDSTDFSFMSQQDATLIIMHEMGHVLGLGTFWQWKCGVNCVYGDYSYTCSGAVDAYNDLGIGTYPGLLLNDAGGQGSVCSHWDDSSFSSWYWSDLMTPFFDANKEQLITTVDLAALEDIGDYQVDYNQADAIPSQRLAETIQTKKSVPSRTFSLEGRILPTHVQLIPM